MPFDIGVLHAHLALGTWTVPPPLGLHPDRYPLTDTRFARMSPVQTVHRDFGWHIAPANLFTA
jgi:hypothetical protein